MRRTVFALVLVLIILLSGCGTAASDAESSSENTQIRETIDLSDIDWKTHPQDYKLIAFTFDDAPSFKTASENVTTHIIDTLNKYNGAGTLFVIGKNIDKNGTILLNYALSKGFEIGNHGNNHVRLDELSHEEIVNEITDLNTKVKILLDVDMHWFRPPFLKTSDAMFSVCTELSMPVISGSRNASLYDYDSAHDSKFVKDTCLENAYDGQIVLMHGYSETTDAVIEEICETLYKQDYRFVTLSELFEYKYYGEIPTDRLIYEGYCW